MSSPNRRRDAAELAAVASSLLLSFLSAYGRSGGGLEEFLGGRKEMRSFGAQLLRELGQHSFYAMDDLPLQTVPLPWSHHLTSVCDGSTNSCVRDGGADELWVCKSIYLASRVKRIGDHHVHCMQRVSPKISSKPTETKP